jgi:cytochrome oxidase assembly protein ShyY1
MVVLFVPIAIYLGLWQLERSEQRNERNRELISQLQAESRSLEQVPDTASLKEWTPVSTSGRFEIGTDILVRRRQLGGFNGFYVLSAFRSEDGKSYLVNRGWLLAKGAADAEIAVPPAPVGPVRLDARWRTAEEVTSALPADLPDRQVLVIAPSQIVERYKKVGLVDEAGYLQANVAQSQVPEALETVTLPAIGQGPHLAYAVQWMIFGAAAVVGWFLLAKREIGQR